MSIALLCQTKVGEFIALHYPEEEKISRVGNLGLGVLAFVSYLFGSIAEIGEGFYISCADFTNKKAQDFCLIKRGAEKNLDQLFTVPYRFFLRAINPDAIQGECEIPSIMNTAMENFWEPIFECNDNLFKGENYLVRHVLGRACVIAVSIMLVFSIVIDVAIGITCASLSLVLGGGFSSLNDRAYVQLSATNRIRELILLVGAILHGSFG